MTMRTGVCAAISWFALGAQALAAPPGACVTPAEASGLMLVMAPEAFKAAGTACAAALPPTALLRQSNSALLQRYQAEAEAAWPAAKGAFGKLIGKDDAAFAQSDLMRPLLTALLAPAIAKDIKPADCPRIDHIVTLLAPLPPRNAADLVVEILQLTNAADAHKGKKSDLPLCPAAAGQP